MNYEVLEKYKFLFNNKINNYCYYFLYNILTEIKLYL